MFSGYSSIHALVTRATLEIIGNIYDNPISIHALVKRATDIADSGCAEKVYFNPRPREEGDCDLVPEEMWANVISIHALVKRATYQ
ncbi:hypothetical protein PZH37_19210, partial [[Eubacterium] siraeum]|nr:hypothetical protein [[Eubacterium] siraeum]